MGGRESAEVLRKRQLQWREQHRKEWRQLRAAQKRRYYAQSKRNNRRKGKRWTPVEDARLTAKGRPTDRKLSKSMGRSVQAIQQRRSSLPRATPDLSVSRRPFVALSPYLTEEEARWLPPLTALGHSMCSMSMRRT
jgi:hypothetical protein